MPRKRALLPFAIAVPCFLALMALEVWRPLPYLRTENALHDAITRAGRRTAPNPDLIFLAIDSDSTGQEMTDDLEELYGLTDTASAEARGLRLMSALFPWNREIYGLVLERLVKSGAKVVLFDLLFPTAADGDAPFRLQLDRYRDHVVIGSNFASSFSRGFTTTGASHNRPAETIIPQTKPMDDRVAYVNFWPDADEIVRRAQYRFTFNQLQVHPNERNDDGEQFLSLAARSLIKAGHADAVPPGLEARRFRYTAPAHEGFSPHSIFEIFVPEYWKRNYKSGEFFRGKIVVVGAEGSLFHDELATPFGLMPGPEVHLNAINAALHGEFITEAPLLVIVLVTLLAAAAAIAMSLVLRSPWMRVIALIAMNAAGGFGALYLFNHASFLAPVLAPLAEGNLTILIGLIADFGWERLERARVRRTFERYVSHDVVRQMLDNPTAYAEDLGGVLKPATILFSDIRGYSDVTMRSDPHVLVQQLNEYLTAMVECVFRHGGTLDKFIGDAVMAVWGNVRTTGVGNDATAAVRAALAMHEELARLNAKWHSAGLPEFRVGIAVHHGEVVVGNIGSPQRMEFTVIGEAVNVTWKLQEFTKEVGCGLIASKSLASLVIEHFEMRTLGPREVRGLLHPLEVFAVSRAIPTPDDEAIAALSPS